MHWIALVVDVLRAAWKTCWEGRCILMSTLWWQNIRSCVDFRIIPLSSPLWNMVDNPKSPSWVVTSTNGLYCIITVVLVVLNHLESAMILQVPNFHHFSVYSLLSQKAVEDRRHCVRPISNSTRCLLPKAGFSNCLYALGQAMSLIHPFKLRVANSYWFCTWTSDLFLLKLFCLANP